MGFRRLRFRAGYSAEAIEAIAVTRRAGIATPERPDIIMVMSESFWDPTRLPAVDFNRDPIPTVRANTAGSIFSPEFGGMTSIVAFEALTDRKGLGTGKMGEAG